MNTASNDFFFNLIQSLAPTAVMFFIVGIVAFAVWIAYTIRLWLVQTATFQIQEDLRDIRNHLLRDENQEEAQLQPSNDDVYVSGEEKRAVIAEDYKKIKPRRAFVWLAVTIPVLLIVLVVIQKIN